METRKNGHAVSTLPSATSPSDSEALNQFFKLDGRSLGLSKRGLEATTGLPPGDRTVGLDTPVELVSEFDLLTMSASLSLSLEKLPPDMMTPCSIPREVKLPSSGGSLATDPER